MIQSFRKWNKYNIKFSTSKIIFKQENNFYFKILC